MAHIELHGARNVRDLGDFATADGRKTARGRLLRGDSLAALNDSDLAVLAGFGLRTVIDFRGPNEIANHGADRVPAGARRVGIPITGGDLGAMLRAAAGETSPAEQQQLLGEGRAAKLMIDANRRFVSDPGFRAGFGEALAIIADPGHGPVLFHCTAGKDRTGWMAAIVLTALGVPREAIVADYLATNDYVWDVYGAWLDRLVESGALADVELIRPLLFQDASYLGAAFDEVERQYGSFDRYLADGLGVGGAQLDALRSALLA
jgi:protein-tyrosine phosphatase